VQNEVEALINEVIEGQKQKLLELGRRFVPKLTSEDILQPNDYPELEYQPLFRYEEGVLEGILTLRMALLAYYRDTEGAK
jgi:hypothetical protein